MDVTGLQLCYKCCPNPKLYFKDLISKAVALGYLSSPLKPLVKNNRWVLFIYDGCLCWWYFRRRDSRLDIHWFKRAHEGGVIYECIHAFCPSWDDWDDWLLQGSVMSVWDRKIWGEMPGIKNVCHVGCPASGLFLTFVLWGRGWNVCAWERERMRKTWKSVWERENRVSEAEDEGRKAVRGERGLVLSHGCGSMPSDNPALTNSEQEVYTENYDSCPQCVCVSSVG